MKDTSVLMTDEYRARENVRLWDELRQASRDAQIHLGRLRMKLAVTYWVVIVLCIVMFAIGIALLGVPYAYFLSGRVKDYQALIAAGFGVADLATLFFFGPIGRIHRMMGDMSQVIVALNGYQSQAALRYLQMDATNRASIGQAAEYIKDLVSRTIILVQRYFEPKEPARLRDSSGTAAAPSPVTGSAGMRGS